MRALIFDLNRTLVDTVYAHALSWQIAFAEAGIPIEGWRLHRRLGMSGGLFTRTVARELNRTIMAQELDVLYKCYAQLFNQFLPKPVPLPGAVELLRFLRESGVCHGIATWNRRPHRHDPG